MHTPDPSEVLRNNTFIAKWMQYEVIVAFQVKREFGRGHVRHFVIPDVSFIPILRRPKDLEFHWNWQWFMNVYREVRLLSGDKAQRARIKRLEYYVLCANIVKAYEELVFSVFYYIENGIKNK